MTKRMITLIAAALWLVALTGVAHARNPHCAGGIQYVVNGLKDKEKGNMEDWERQMNKAVTQLEMCAEQDPHDLEPLGYLGWAYAELDRMEEAGEAFSACIAGFQEKGDEKKVQWATNNRESYWARSFNEGIQNIQAAQAAYDPFTKEPENEADETLKEEARKLYEKAVTSLQNAAYLKPGDVQTVRNYGTAYMLMGEYQEAAEIYANGLEAAPDDEELTKALAQARTLYANQLIDEGKTDEAIAFFEELANGDAANADVYLGLAEARFRQAQSIEDASRSMAFKDAGDAYSKAAELRGGDADLSFNAALAYQNAGEWELAAAEWERCIAVRPDDTDALSAYASTLAELGRFDDAIDNLHHAIAVDPKKETLHRQLGAVYTKAGDNAKATEELMVYLALSKGTPADNAPAAANASSSKHGGAVAKTLTEQGVPEFVVHWEADGEPFESWFYWSKHKAFHFKGKSLQITSDWSAAAGQTAEAK